MPLVLIVDDEPKLATAEARILAAAGYDVVTVGDGNEALATLAAMPHLPDVILMDLAMPGMDGWELLRTLRSYTRLASIPVIVVSAYTDLKPIASPAVLRLGKPFDTDDLLTAVAAYAPVDGS